MLQECKWAATSSKSNLPVGQRCLACATALAKCCPFESWDETLHRVGADPAYKEEIMLAVQIEKKKAERTWPAESYLRHVESGYVVEYGLVFFNEKQYEERFGHKPVEAGLVVEQVQLEPHSKPSSGVLLREAPSAEGTKIKLFHSFAGELSTVVVNGSESLRQALASETQQRYEQGFGGKVNKALQKAQSSAPLVSDVPGMRAQWLESQKKKQEEAEERKALTEPVAVASDAESDKEDAESEEHVVDHVQQATWLPDSKGKGKWNKPVQTGKDRRAAGSQLAMSLVKNKFAEKARSRASSVAGSAVSGAGPRPGDSVSVAGESVASTKRRYGLPKLSPKEKYTKKAKEWIESIDISAVLEGTSVGQDAYRATETLKALERHRGTCAESVLLQSHVDIAVLAEARTRINLP